MISHLYNISKGLKYVLITLERHYLWAYLSNSCYIFPTTSRSETGKLHRAATARIDGPGHDAAPVTDKTKNYGLFHNRDKITRSYRETRFNHRKSLLLYVLRSDHSNTGFTVKSNSYKFIVHCFIVTKPKSILTNKYYYKTRDFFRLKAARTCD